MSGGDTFGEKKKKKNWNWNWNAQKNKKQKKRSQKKRERGGGGVGLREEEDEEDDDDEQQQQQQQPWRGTKKKRTCVSMILSVLMCFSLSVSFFFPFVSPQLCRFVYILLRLCLYLKLTTNDAFRNVDANKNRACSTNGSLGSKSCSPESTALGEDRTTRSNATISLRRINSGLKF